VDLEVACDGSEVTVTVERWKQGSGDAEHEMISFPYRMQGGGFRSYSDLDIMLELGVPKSYLQGLWAAAKFVGVRRDIRNREKIEVRDAREKVKEAQQRSKRSRERAIKARQKLRSEDQFKREVAAEVRKHSEELERRYKQKEVELNNRVERAEMRVSALRAKLDMDGMLIPESLEEIKGDLYPVCTTLEECGVYFLVDNGEVVYVGQSINVSSRVSNHFKDKTFEHAFAIACCAAELDDVERKWIDKLLPIYNRDFRTLSLRKESEESSC